MIIEVYILDVMLMFINVKKKIIRINMVLYIFEEVYGL